MRDIGGTMSAGTTSRTTFLTLTVVLVTLPLTVRIGDAYVAVATVAVIVLCAVGAARASSPQVRPMELVFWCFSGIWLGAGSLYQLATGEVAWSDTSRLADPGMNLEGQLLTLAALATFAVGTEVVRRRPPRTAVADRPVPTRGGPRSTSAAVWRLPAVYLAVAILLLPAVAAANGGLTTLFQSRQLRADAFLRSGQLAGSRASDGLLRIFPASLALAGCYVALLLLLLTRTSRLQPRASRVRGPALTIAVVGLGLMVVYVNPLSMSRYISGAAFAALVLLVWQPRSARAGLLLIGGAAVGLLFVYPLAYSLRGSSAQTHGGSWWSVLSSNDFDGYQQVLNTVQMVQQRGHSNGIHTLSAFLYLVPRSVWPAKASPASLDVAGNRGYSFTDLSLPLHAELYLDLGLVGMVVVLFALGALAAFLDQRWLRRPRSTAAQLVPYLCMAQVGLLRGPLGSLIPVAMTAAVLLAPAVRLATRGIAGGSTPGAGPVGGDETSAVGRPADSPLRLQAVGPGGE